MYVSGRLIQMKSEMAAGAAEIEKESLRKTMIMEEITSSSSKRRKITDDLSFSSGSADSLNNSATPSHNFKATDLKGENSGTEVSMFSNGEFSEETTSPSGELCVGDSGEAMEESSSSTTQRKISLQKSRASAETPPAEEIEEFFSAAEMYEQKRFAEKYNYDIVKDVPLEGRYKWIPLKVAMNKKGTKEISTI